MPVLWKTWTEIGSKLKLVWLRLTISWITILYFSVIIIHCLVQIGLQANAFAINASAANLLFSLLYAGHFGNETEGFAVILGGSLRICYEVPIRGNTSECIAVSNSTGSPHWSIGMDINDPLTYLKTVSATAAFVNSTGDIPPVPSSSVESVDLQPTQSISIYSDSIAISNLHPTSLIPSPTITIVDQLFDDDNDTPITGYSEGYFPQEIVQELAETFSGHARTSRTIMLASHILRSDDTLQLSNECIKTLIYPAQILANTKREDITLVGFQIWVLGLSLVALLNESIPHLFASVATQLLITIWTIVQIFQTEHFRKQLIILSVNHTCSPNSLLGGYWHKREMVEIASASLNGIVFIMNLFLHYNLMKLFGWQTFKRLGASLTINRIYKFVLLQSIAIQMALFFMVATAALWIDQLYNGSVGQLATYGKLYKAGACIMFILLIPWLTLGWFTIRLEMRRLFLIFLFLNLIFIGLWAGIFDSTSFRWTFVLWPFFAVMVCVSGTLMLTTLGLGVICRLNFGKGLPRYLRSLAPSQGLSEYLDVERNAAEKVNFPDMSLFNQTPTGILVTNSLVRTFESSNNADDDNVSLQSDLDRVPSQSSRASSATNGTDYRIDAKYKRWVIE